MAIKDNYLDTETKKIYRICDANFNRAKEGLRVVEEYIRFYKEDENSLKNIREIRHTLSTILEKDLYEKLLKERDVFNDHGMQFKETDRTDLNSLLIANIKRIQEALRVLEEYSKIVFKDKASYIKNLRFKTYNLEKMLHEK